MRAAIAAESAGIPSVSIVCEGFAGQALATGRGYGFDSLAIAQTVGHVDAQSADEMVANFVAVTVDQVVAGLTAVVDSEKPGSNPGSEPTALTVVATGSIDEINTTFQDRWWTDGNPIIPPTQDRVEAFLAVLGHDPWKVLGVAPSSGRDVTVWSIGVNLSLIHI